VEAFDIKGLQASPGRFDKEKLNWLNGHAIRAMDSEELLERLIVFADSMTSSHLAHWTPDPETGDAPDIDVEGAVRKIIALAEHAKTDRTYTLSAVKLEQERVHTLMDFGEACRFFFLDEVEFDPKATAKWFGEPHVREMFEFILEKLGESRVETVEHYSSLLHEYQARKGFEKLGPVVHPTRVALTGKTFGPGLFELMSALGHDRIAKRLNHALTLLP
jgi:glutamyl-tRNA synthetase